jgi:hypothetical protein
MTEFHANLNHQHQKSKSALTVLNTTSRLSLHLWQSRNDPGKIRPVPVPISGLLKRMADTKRFIFLIRLGINHQSDG